MTAPIASSPLGPQTVLRLLTARDAPYPGALVAGDPPSVWVDDSVVAETAMWRAAAGGHVLSALDAARTATGGAVIVPHCPARLREAADERTAGEAVTIAVSILRGASEAHALGAESGSWWVTAEGRPVLALQAEGDWAAEASGVLRILAEAAGPAAREVLIRCAEHLSRGDVPAAARCEDELFALADPAPLELSLHRTRASATGTLTTARATRRPLAEAAASAVATPARASSLTRRDAPSDPSRDATARRGGIVGELLARLVDTELADRVQDAVRSLPRRRPAPPLTSAESETMTASTPAGARRRRPWLVAAAVGVVVTVIGLAWPDGSATLEKPLTPHVPSGRASPAAPTASGSRPPAVAPESDAASTSAAHTPGASPAGEADLLAIAQEAIAALATCSRDASTACAVWEDASRPLPDGPLVDADAPPALRLLDDYGGVAALRADARDGTAQVVVIVQGPETWLVRDVYDVADQ